VRAEAVREALLPAAGLVVTLAYGAFVAWVYAARPQSIGDVTTMAQVAAGVYRVDDARFASGLSLFRREAFAAARDEWARADPAQRDPRTQFYVAYSYYRQGWGRFHHDDALYRDGLAAVQRAQAASAGAPWASDDPGLGLRTPSELKAEIERGLRTELEDFNPLRMMEPRK
jgi:pimeloyl-ACP methyl ester carboxylesterase